MDKKDIVGIQDLPEGCIANIISFTSPRDACCFSLVSSMFKNASLSDTVWDRFLPHDLHSLISQSSDPRLLSSSSSKKDIFFSLCRKPIIIDNGKKSFGLDKLSWKKCFMLSAKYLRIIWGSTPTYWRWNSDTSSRFGEVAELINVCWLEISGKISTSLLSPSTLYSAYLVYKLGERVYGLDLPPAEAIVGVRGESESSKRKIYLDTSLTGGRQGRVLPRRGTGGRFLRRFPIVEVSEASEPSRENSRQGPKERADGWLEVELGEFCNKDGDDEELEISVLEVKSGKWKRGLIVEGIEIRPKVR